MWQLTAKHGKRKGRSWPITDEPIVIGRNPSCGITLRDSLVSREHCRINVIDGELFLEDLGSSNCTLVNGRPVTRCVLTVGDELATGEVTFVVTRSGIEDSGTGTPMMLNTTQHLMLEPFASARGHDVDSGTLNVKELAQLHVLGNALATCGNTAEIFRAVVECINEHCAPPELFLAKVDAPSNALTYPPSLVLEAGVSEHLKRFVAQAPLQPEFYSRRLPDGTQVVTSFIPLRMNGSFAGVLGGSQTIGERSDLEPYLLFAGNAARLVAPYLVAVSDGFHGIDSSLRLAEAQSSFLGESEAAEQARRLIAIAATADLPVLIQGETGTGKELAAHLIHELSDRSNSPFVTVNCAAITDDLFESEVFGHTKGAFTGAASDREGLLAEAHGGHLFLDEIVDLSTRNQSRFLRAIETGQFRPLGAGKDRVAQFSVVSATNRDLFAAVEAGRFREDLYYRISAIEVFLPPLSERTSDIPLLATHFADEFARDRNIRPITFEDDALDFLIAKPWRGNVRELRNCISRVASFAPAQRVSRSLVERIVARPSSRDAGDSSRRIEEIERLHIERVLTECGGRISEAADVLGMHRNTLSKKLKNYRPST